MANNFATGSFSKLHLENLEAQYAAIVTALTENPSQLEYELPSGQRVQFQTLAAMRNHMTALATEIDQAKAFLAGGNGFVQEI